MAKTVSELDLWREAVARAKAGEEPGYDADGNNYTEPFDDVRRRFLAWFGELERLATAVRDPFAPAAVEALAGYQHDDARHDLMGSTLLDLVEAGEALRLRLDSHRDVDVLRALRRAQSPRAGVQNTNWN